MSRYSIKDLELISGIKAHTLRIWEQRYGLFNPNRTETNIRLYSDEDLRKLLNISILNANGFKISKIVQFSDDELLEKVRHLSLLSISDYSLHIDKLVISMLELNDEHFEDSLNYSISMLGFESTVLDVIFPFLQRIGIMWQTGAINPAQEHFISNLVRQKILSAIDNLPHQNYDENEKYLLFLPDGELHEIGLLFNYYLLKRRGKKVIYLGQSVPFDDLTSVYKVHQPKFLVSIFTFSFEMISVSDYIDKLSSLFKDSVIYLSGFQLSEFQSEIPQNVIFYKTAADFIKLIDKN